MTLQPCRECGHRVSTEAARCPACGIAHPMRSRASRRRWRTVLGVLTLAAGAFGGGALARRYLPPAPTEPARPGPAATTFPSLSAVLGRSSSEIVVTNENDFAWTECTVDVNAGVPGGGYSQALGRVDAGQRAAAPLRAFVRQDGQRYDPDAQRLQVVDLHCDTPSGRAHFNGVF